MDRIDKINRTGGGELDRINRIDRIGGEELDGIDDLTGKVIGLAMKVHRFFGVGYLEEVYKNALMVEFERAGIKARKEVPIAVEYEGVNVGNYAADIIVEDRLVLELKAVNALHPRHEAQLVNYLSATKIDDGILLNFGADSLQFKHKFRVYRKSCKSC